MPKTTIWLARRTLKMVTRPNRSESNPQNRRPNPLQIELAAMSVAPYSASVVGSIELSARPQISWRISDWKLITEIPAAILKKKTIHMMMNWVVRRYVPADSGSPYSRESSAAAAAREADAGGSLRARLHGIRMQPNMTPSQMKTSGRVPAVLTIKNGARPLLRRKAPTPKPMTTIPVARPLRSGNHFATVATGVTYPSPIPAPPITP